MFQNDQWRVLLMAVMMSSAREDYRRREQISKQGEKRKIDLSKLIRSLMLLSILLFMPLSTAFGQSLSAQYRPSWGIANQDQIVPAIDVKNIGSTTVAMSAVTVRYWYTIDTSKPLTYACDSTLRGCSNVRGKFVALSQPFSNADYYLELSFTSGAGELAPGESFGAINSRFSKTDWSLFDQSNDYSFDGTRTAMADSAKITVYVNGTRVWGNEPGSSDPGDGSGTGTDTVVPTAPTNLAGSNVTSDSVTLTWTGSTDNVGVVGYEVYAGSTGLGSTTSTSYIASGLTADKTYSFSVKAKDAAGNSSVASSPLTIATLPVSGSQRHQADYPSADPSACGIWALTDNVCCAQYCSNDNRSENCDGCGGSGSSQCVKVSSKACSSGEWPEVHSIDGTESWHYSRSTHYGMSYAGACGFGMYSFCSTKYKNTPQCDAFCKAYPDLCKDPANITLRGNFAAPPGNYYSQFWSSLPGDRDNYLSCGECFEVVRTKKDGSEYQPGESGYTPPIVLQIADSCPCSANSKWCCGSGRDHCGEVSDFKYGCQLPGDSSNLNRNPSSDESIHLDLSDAAMVRLQTGDANGSMVEGVIPTKYKRVSCPVVGNAYIWLRSGASRYWFALSVVNTAGLGSVTKVEAQLKSGDWVALKRDPNYTSARPQERYGTWVVPQGYGPFDLPFSLRITDPSGRAIVAKDVVKSWTPVDQSLLDTYYIDTGVQF